MVGVYILVSELILVSSLFKGIFPQEFLLGNGQKVTLYFTVSPLKIMRVFGQYYRSREDCMLHANSFGETETTRMCVKFLSDVNVDELENLCIEICKSNSKPFIVVN